MGFHSQQRQQYGILIQLSSGNVAIENPPSIKPPSMVFICFLKQFKTNPVGDHQLGGMLIPC